MALSGTYDTLCSMKRSVSEVSTLGDYCDEEAECQLERERHSLRDCLPASHGLLLDQALWSRLPLELLERVIGKLPIDAMLRFRSVCKAWKAYISSYQYAELSYTIPNQGPWCLAMIPDMQGIAVYDVSKDRWHHLPLPSTAANDNMQPFGSAGGFVCFKNFDNSKFFIYNPLTRSCSALTPKRQRAVSIKDEIWVVTDQSECFNVLVVRDFELYEVYDSFRNRWSKPRMLPHNIKLSQESRFPYGSISSDGTLYMVSKFPFDLVTYDTITGSWSKLYVQWPENCWNHILSEYRGRIYMLALQMENERLTFCEWELHSTQMLWVKVEMMPETFCHEVLGDENKDWHVQSLANRDMLLLRFVNSNMQEHILVLYNRIQKLWKRISNPPTFPDRPLTDQWPSKVSK